MQQTPSRIPPQPPPPSPSPLTSVGNAVQDSVNVLNPSRIGRYPVHLIHPPFIVCFPIKAAHAVTPVNSYFKGEEFLTAQQNGLESRVFVPRHRQRLP